MPKVSAGSAVAFLIASVKPPGYFLKNLGNVPNPRGWGFPLAVEPINERAALSEPTIAYGRVRNFHRFSSLMPWNTAPTLRPSFTSTSRSASLQPIFLLFAISFTLRPSSHMPDSWGTLDITTPSHTSSSSGSSSLIFALCAGSLNRFISSSEPPSKAHLGSTESSSVEPAVYG